MGVGGEGWSLEWAGESGWGMLERAVVRIFARCAHEGNIGNAFPEMMPPHTDSGLPQSQLRTSHNVHINKAGQKKL